MDLGVFYEVVVPLMEVKGTATIAISTPLGAWNFYSELTELRDANGKLVFNVKHIDSGKRPVWKPEETLSKVKAIYGNRKTLLEREILGKISDAVNTAFNRHTLKEFFDGELWDPSEPINDNKIYIALDPNGGANASNASGSDTALVAFFMSRGRLVVCALDAFGTNDVNQPWLMFRAMTAKLRGVARYAACEFVGIFEANLGDQAQYVAHHALAQLSDVKILCQHQHCYGVFTTPGVTEKYVFRMREKLQERAVCYAPNLLSANPFETQMSSEELVTDNKRKFERQLAKFQMVFNVPKSILSKIGITYTGKSGKDGERSTREQDDLCMAFLFGFFYYCQLTADPPRAHLKSYRNALMYHRPEN